MRIVITGGPRTGKTTMSCEYTVPVRHTDDLVGLGWSEASSRAAVWFDAPGPWVIEGVACVRALRKWLARGPLGKPCDVVLWLGTHHDRPTPGQSRMAKGCLTVMDEIRDELIRRGVRVETRS